MRKNLSEYSENKKITLLLTLFTMVMFSAPIATVMVLRVIKKKETGLYPTYNVTKSYEISLPRIQLNIAGTNGKHFIQVDIAVEVNSPDMIALFTEYSLKNPQGKKKLILSQVISLIGEKTFNELLAQEAKRVLSNEIKIALNDLSYQNTNGIITEVYFYGFLVQ